MIRPNVITCMNQQLDREKERREEQEFLSLQQNQQKLQSQLNIQQFLKQTSQISEVDQSKMIKHTIKETIKDINKMNLIVNKEMDSQKHDILKRIQMRKSLMK